MGPLTEKIRGHTSDRKRDQPWVTPDLGLVLLDSSFHVVAATWEAAAILSYPEPPSHEREVEVQIPEEILESLRSQDQGNPAPVTTHFRAGRRKYICQAHSLHACGGASQQPAIALLFHRNSSATETIHEIASEFNLTDREREALQGISLGLSSKELAAEMKISANTVKVYIRFIMVKMGVSTRAGIVAKILEHNANGKTGAARRAVRAGA